MAGRFPLLANGETGPENFTPTVQDYQWVRDQIGDVPRRHTAEQWTPAELEGMNYLIEHAKRYEFNRIPDYFGETVPVESLGRDDGWIGATLQVQENPWEPWKDVEDGHLSLDPTVAASGLARSRKDSYGY